MTFFSYLWYLTYNLLTVLSVGNAQRKITGGRDVTMNHTYMVYIIEGNTSSYTGWMCGGALIGRRIVLTAAACIEDVRHLYVIAGYPLYITMPNRQKDPCISKMKKKVISACVPEDYNLTYSRLDKWASYDIAVIKVESNIADEPDYAKYCHYVPKVISINFNNKEMQNTGRDALVLGWGHKTSWREREDLNDLNQRTLQYGATKIYNKTRCRKHYKNTESLIEKYMICAWPPGAFNDRGSIEEFQYNKSLIIDGDNGDHDGCNSEEGKDSKDGKDGKVDKKDVDISSKELRDNQQVGICQNDHGSPLISWHRSKPKVIGVASVFRIDKNRKCHGPYLFTSTYCSAMFLKCVIKEFIKDEEENQIPDQMGTLPPIAIKRTTAKKKKMLKSSDFCQLPPKEKGFEILKRRISWRNHIDGPAKGEKYRIRPQQPLQSYRR